ncbi:recombinase family protein [Enterococcus gallinarum]|uniref:recombinase family protein n=1 Tax=Enterococcus gallinarum TaxID=1353 RepID=UPI00345852E8
MAIYMRVSTDQQAKHGDSLREQQETLNEYIKQNKDLTVVGEYIDGGISGQKLNRDEFQRLLEDVQNDLIDLIIFTKLDRWFRNLRHYLNTQEILEKHNVSWNAVSQQYYDTTTAYGRTFIAQVMSFAELEAQMTSERIKAVFNNKIQQGEVVSGKIPLGYSVKNKHLVPNEDKRIVIDLFNFYMQIGSLRQCVKYLEEEHGLIRDYQSVRNMLTNMKYIGVHRNNLNYCEPIIDKDIFEIVQKRLSQNIKNDSKHEYIFRGLVRCADCGGSMSCTTFKSKYKRKADGETSIYIRTGYRCTKRKNNHNRCVNKKIFYEKMLEQYILDNIKPQISKFITTTKNEARKKDSIKRKKDAIFTKLERLKKAYLNEVIELEEYKKDRQNLEQELAKIREPKISNNIKSLNSILSEEFFSSYKESNVQQKNELWRTILESIDIDHGGNITINFLQ